MPDLTKVIMGLLLCAVSVVNANSGDMTFFHSGLGSCSQTNGDGDAIVALPPSELAWELLLADQVETRSEKLTRLVVGNVLVIVTAFALGIASPGSTANIIPEVGLVPQVLYLTFLSILRVLRITSLRCRHSIFFIARLVVSNWSRRIFDGKKRAARIDSGPKIFDELDQNRSLDFG
ncbi:Uu.00g133820.m01.CDS01 [Anthostomella pinea]|uniref:Uu.00g133820.m01.CDS01 n=1 Tax=Anthostomella pinea TaxID=933095 RepID=A0AAI8YKM8_9PEZI|nr:Uu.00g133820.m01.CDS01 [Anthostomella pinea]